MRAYRDEDTCAFGSFEISDPMAESAPTGLRLVLHRCRQIHSALRHFKTSRPDLQQYAPTEKSWRTVITYGSPQLRRLLIDPKMGIDVIPGMRRVGLYTGSKYPER
jgi:hypothetical protein